MVFQGSQRSTDRPEPSSNARQPSEVRNVSEKDLGRVRAGQTVDLSVDAYPKETFRGNVTTIGSRAEFTPRNVTTAKDRQALVFAIKVRVPNPGGELKAGLPVDATFED